jgi:hypothetical protein
VKFSGSLVPIIAARPARCASAAFITWIFHKLSLSYMKAKCNTVSNRHMCCASPLSEFGSAFLCAQSRTDIFDA